MKISTANNGGNSPSKKSKASDLDTIDHGQSEDHESEKIKKMAEIKV